jgi:hypothetical protein
VEERNKERQEPQPECGFFFFDSSSTGPPVFGSALSHETHTLGVEDGQTDTMLSWSFTDLWTEVNGDHD